MPQRGRGNRPMVRLFGTKNYRSRPRVGEGRTGRSCPPRRLLPDRRGPASARASHRREITTSGTVAPLASCTRGGRLLRKPLAVHGRLGGGSSPFRCWVGSLGDTGASGTSATPARE